MHKSPTLYRTYSSRVDFCFIVTRNEAIFLFLPSLQSAILTVGELSSSGETDNLVEMCECPEGYTGMSCEKCAWGYVKMPMNVSDLQDHYICEKCDCNGHAGSCDLVMGECRVSPNLY